MNSKTPNVLESNRILGNLAIALVLLCLSACEVAEKSDSNNDEVAPLNISTEKTLVLDADQSLTQIARKSNSSGALSAYLGLESVNDILGNAVAAEFLLPVNDRYVFVKNFGKRGGRNEGRHVILDLKTGKHVSLKYWPINPARIASSSSTAYYVSNMCILAVELASGKTESISCETNEWHYSLSGYSDNRSTFWTGREWLYIDSNSNLYAINYSALNNGYATGLAGKFSKQNGEWSEDVQFHNSFPSMPYGLSNQIPGALLSNSKWLVVDANSAALYLAEFNGASMSLRSYDLATWSAGSVLSTFSLSHSVTNTTFLGLNNYIQKSLITDGQSIIRINSNSGVISIEEIAVPSSIPVETTIGSRTQGYVQYWPRGSVTNWNYLQNDLYFFNSVDGLTYSWDLNASHSPEVIENSENIRFIY